MKKVISIILLLATATVYASGNENPGLRKEVRLSTGITMSYTERGNIGGRAVVFLHGFADTRHSYDLVVEEMVRKYPHVRIIVPDLRGHGATSMPSRRACGSSPENCFTPAEMAADVVALLNALDLDAVYLVGHSMGSIIAQELAIKYPERVSSMVLIGTYVYGKELSVISDYLLGTINNWREMLETEPDFNWPLDAYAMTPADFGAAEVQQLRNNWVSEAGVSEDYLDAICKETVKTPLGTWVGVATALSKVDNRKALESLKVPTLVLWATQDHLLDKTEQDRVLETLQVASRVNNTAVVFKTYGRTYRTLEEPQSDLGHNFHWAAPTQVADDILSFIRTGYPRDTQVWLNPQNPNEVMEAPGAAEITAWGVNRIQANRQIR
ncbi:MAG TPA: alpha/beta hydrolase [Cyclobacteriaceae bacterium]|jgi:pimeloyl-ACP methyl ester carboxylesterase